ncbi:MAG: ABC transporter permease, partial [Chloroflexi bacterium]|nr:ABC transporter permease [Chloroflexota bacterium]
MDKIRRTIRPEQIREVILLFLILLAVIFFGTQIEGYYSPRTFTRVSASIAILAVVAVGQTLVVLMRHIDLSVGSIVGFTAYFVGTQIADNNDILPLAAVLMAVGVGGLMGLVNGAIIAYGRVPAIITTLGTLAIYRTLLVEYSDAQTVITSSLPPWLIELPRKNLFAIGEFEVRLMVIIALVVVVTFQLVITYLSYGRRLYAIGSNPEAARIAGMPLQRT